MRIVSGRLLEAPHQVKILRLNEEHFGCQAVILELLKKRVRANQAVLQVLCAVQTDGTQTHRIVHLGPALVRNDLPEP